MLQNALDTSGETGGKNKHGVGSIVSASSMPFVGRFA
jgi:hypothetical protein